MKVFVIVDAATFLKIKNSYGFVDYICIYIVHVHYNKKKLSANYRFIILNCHNTTFERLTREFSELHG